MKRTAVSVVGVGRVGLPLALVLADEGLQVYGVGRSEEKIKLLNQKILPFMEKGADKLMKKYIGKKLFFTTDYRVIKDSDVIILTLGTPVDENMNPVLEQIDQSTEQMIPYLKKDQLIILRSTISPKTTFYVKEKIEIKTKFRVGKNIFLAFCPERIAEGNSIAEIKEIPQIVGGVDKISSQKAKFFFEGIGIKCVVSDAVSAELAKLFTNMYRYISFAMANEFMVIAESFNRSIYEITDLVNKDYKRGGLVLPGLTGGPCLFKDGFFLINDNPYLDLITASWKINEALPLFILKKLHERVKLHNKKIVILGLAFKPEIDDIRESLSFKIRKALVREHAQIVLHDPYVKDYKEQEVLHDLEKALIGAQIVIIATRHKDYVKKKKEIIRNLSKNTYICDIWNIFGTNKMIFKAGQVKNFFN